jgi:tRNA (mo5U34)-methyltransferase
LIVADANSVSDFFWWHSIDLGNGIVTPGVKSIDQMQEEYETAFGGLDLRGKSVLDVGAWNGAFSIEAKRRGASRVVALDRPREVNMPGAHDSLEFAIRNSGLTIEMVERDIEEPHALDGLGEFDIVAFLGVFYHLVDPIMPLKNLAKIARETLIVETHQEYSGDERPLMIFFPGSELNDDASNWWGPNRACMEALLRTIGFTTVETRQPTAESRLVCVARR